VALGAAAAAGEGAVEAAGEGAAELAAEEAADEAAEAAAEEAARAAAEREAVEAAARETTSEVESAGDSDAASSSDSTDDGESCPAESFTPTTLVKMANGTTEAIKDIKIGDKVLATNPKTGVTVAETVTATNIHDDSDLMDVVVRSIQGEQTIHATDRHPFWDETTNTWTLAENLHSGDLLKTLDGQVATVARTVQLPGNAIMWDLTVSTDHDFYVSVGAGSQTAVLVHNCGDLDSLSQSGSQLDPADSGGNLTRAGRAYAKAGEVFGPTSGGPSAINEAGQNALDDILTDPGTVRSVMPGGNFAGAPVFISPSGVGAVFDGSGVFQYFGAGFVP